MQINRLRDRIDEELFGYQDYALVATRPAEPFELGPRASTRGLRGRGRRGDRMP